MQAAGERLFVLNIPRTTETNSNWSKSLYVTKLQRCHSNCPNQLTQKGHVFLRKDARRKYLSRKMYAFYCGLTCRQKDLKLP